VGLCFYAYNCSGTTRDVIKHICSIHAYTHTYTDINYSFITFHNLKRPVDIYVLIFTMLSFKWEQREMGKACTTMDVGKTVTGR